MTDATKKITETPKSGQAKNDHIRHLFYNWDQEQKIIKEMQQCQRNWDHTKVIHHTVIDYLLSVSYTHLTLPTKA